MKTTKLSVISVSAALSLIACSGDNPVAEPGGEAYPPVESSSAVVFPVESSSAVWNPVDLSSSAMVPVESSSSLVFPVTSSSSIAGPVVSSSSDDENDLEDARTLNGTQILLKLAGTTATVENNNGCVEIADKRPVRMPTISPVNRLISRLW